MSVAGCFEHTDRTDQPIVDFSLRAVIPPVRDVIVHGTFGQEVVRNDVPLASTSALVKAPVEHLANNDAPRPFDVAALARFGDPLAEVLPLPIGQIAGKTLLCAIGALYPPLSRRAHSLGMTDVSANSIFWIGSHFLIPREACIFFP